jgi:DMSO reductase family type II enzyme heme b subunit
MWLGERHRNTVPVRVADSLTIVSAIVLLCLLGCQRSPSSDSSEIEAKSVPSEIEAKPAASTDSSPPSPLSGKELYALHCAACHGENGDGKGIAETFLFPKPRDFRLGRFRLVSTNNNVPTREDLHAVLLRGMPGSSMPPWAHLSQQERDALVDEVMRLRREGARESYIHLLKEDEELTDEEIAADDVQEEIQDYVDDFTTPGESTDVPSIGPSTAEAVARGKEVYAKFVCISCHGETGRGDGVQEMWDDEKMPTRPRDFTIGIFKGNYDSASLYRRIAFGMPGSPMPGSSTITAEQMVDLVHYIRSMSTEEQRQAAVLSRRKIVAKSIDQIPESVLADAWSGVKPVHLRMTPLWWRDDPDVDLTVQAAHDGNMIAVRLTWRDATANHHASLSEAFEDAVAIELYRGAAEPFLGMGDAASPVDVWFWDADRQAPIDVEDQYPNVVVDVYPFNEQAVTTAEYRRAGTSRAEQPRVSLPALASENQIVPFRAMTGGSDLAVGGPGSVTFRVPKSQLVTGLGEWKEGLWSVVMTRPLRVESADDGVSLTPGGKASVAFAVWDGSHQDRDGQKLITIWQDLELER